MEEGSNWECPLANDAFLHGPSLSSQGYRRSSVEHPHHNLPKLETAFLGNVADLMPLQWATNLVTLNLSYSPEYVSEPLPDLETAFSALPLIPNLRTLEISNGEIEASVIVACPKLENLILSETIGTGCQCWLSRFHLQTFTMLCHMKQLLIPCYHQQGKSRE